MFVVVIVVVVVVVVVDVVVVVVVGFVVHRRPRVFVPCATQRAPNEKEGTNVPSLQPDSLAGPTMPVPSGTGSRRPGGDPYLAHPNSRKMTVLLGTSERPRQDQPFPSLRRWTSLPTNQMIRRSLLFEENALDLAGLVPRLGRPHFSGDDCA